MGSKIVAPKKKGRGRPPAGPMAGKTASLSMRITPATDEALRDAAARSKRSLSQEAEFRLGQSFTAELKTDEIVRAFGGPETFAVLQIAAQCIRQIEIPAGKCWFDDAALVERSIDVVSTLMRTFSPTKEQETDRGTLSPDEELVKSVLALVSLGAGAGPGALIERHAYNKISSIFLALDDIARASQQWEGLGILQDRLPHLERLQVGLPAAKKGEEAK